MNTLELFIICVTIISCTAILSYGLWALVDKLPLVLKQIMIVLEYSRHREKGD